MDVFILCLILMAVGGGGLLVDAAVGVFVVGVLIVAGAVLIACPALLIVPAFGGAVWLLLWIGAKVPDYEGPKKTTPKGDPAPSLPEPLLTLSPHGREEIARAFGRPSSNFKP